MSDVNSSFKKDKSYFPHSNSLSTIVENIQSEPVLIATSKYYESEIEDISTTGPSSEIKFVVEHLDNSSSAVSDHSGSHDESMSMEKKGLSTVGPLKTSLFFHYQNHRQPTTEIRRRVRILCSCSRNSHQRVR
jgi:hypothetical protein